VTLLSLVPRKFPPPASYCYWFYCSKFTAFEWATMV